MASGQNAGDPITKAALVSAALFATFLSSAAAANKEILLIGDKPSTVRGKHEHNADVYTFTKWLNTIHGVHGTAIYDTWDDSRHAPRVTIIDDVLVRRQFGDASPLGARLRIQIGQFRDEWVEVVGVVGHVRDDSPEEQGRSQIYFPEA